MVIDIKTGKIIESKEEEINYAEEKFETPFLFHMNMGVIALIALAAYIACLFFMA